MTGWLGLTDDERRSSLTQAQIRSGILPKAIEKDWWVTLVLKALFELPFAEHFIFKGGTSLSKGWRLIDRMSEDVDIGLSPEAFEMGYKPEPSKDYRHKIRKEGCKFTSTTIKKALEEKLNSHDLHSREIEVYAKPVPPDFPDMDPQEISVVYPPLYEANDYLEDKVKIEFSVRSLKEPFDTIGVQSILSEVYPQSIYGEIAFNISAALPHKTFIEKMFLLHEKLVKPERLQQDLERQSRHLYDLVQMTEKGTLAKVQADGALYDTIIQHRRNWIKLKDVDYDKLQRASLSFVPSGELLNYFRDDYTKMLELLIYGDPPDFDTIINRLKEINVLFNAITA